MADYSDEDGYVVLDPVAMERLSLDRGLSVRGFASLVGISPTTAGRFFRRERVQIGTVKRAFEELEIADIRPYLIGGGSVEAEFGQRDAGVLAEWEIENALTRPVQLSNGLAFRIFRLRHGVLPNLVGRGKCYELSKLNTRDDERVREQLLRHPRVCRSVSECPYFPVNERVLYSEDKSRFWVIDRGFDGLTLEDRLRLHGPLRGNKLAKAMTETLRGIHALHEQNIIRRELSSKYIVLSQPDGDVLLTELELAKLVEGAISVSGAWDDDPFRAPEIENDEITPSVDLYSWGQVLFHAATGRLPNSPANEDQFEDLDLPIHVKKIARNCVSPSYKFRHYTASDALTKLGDWYRE